MGSVGAAKKRQKLTTQPTKLHKRKGGRNARFFRVKIDFQICKG